VSVTVLELIESLEADGVRFRLDGDRVKAIVPDPTPPHISKTLGTLRAHRSEVATLLRERTRPASPVSQGESLTQSGLSSPQESPEPSMRERPLADPATRPFVERFDAELVEENRDDRKAVIEMLRNQEGKRPPSLEDLRRLLPGGVRLIRYSPKKPPVAVALISIVTDVDKFIRAYLRDLGQRLQHPGTHACAPLPEILAKLAEVGLELALDGRHTDSVGTGGEREGRR
jgi:hypothetical protein